MPIAVSQDDRQGGTVPMSRSICFVLISSVICLFCTPRVATAEHNVTLLEGRSVTFIFDDPLNSKTAQKGDPVILELVSDLTVDDVTIAKARRIVSGTITSVHRAAVPGRSAEVSFELSMRSGDATIVFRASRENGSDNSIRYSRPRHLKYIFGIFRPGDDVEVDKGTLLTVYVAIDVPLSFAQFSIRGIISNCYEAFLSQSLNTPECAPIKTNG